MGKTFTCERHTNRILTTVLTFVLAVSCCLITDSCKTKQQNPYEGKDEEQIYEEEKARFNKVLDNASDEELFLVLQYAITQGYVPSIEIDPYFNIHVGVSPWFRTLEVYRKIANRTDLLQQIYPDVEVLREYVFSGGYSEPYDLKHPDVKETIMHNIQKNCPNLDSLMDLPHPTTLKEKYFRNWITYF